MVNRRKLLKQFVIMGAGMAIIPSCLSDKSKSSILLSKIKIDGDDEMMLAELCESIIPKTNTPGAKEIGAHLFVLKMVDDCAKKDDRDKFMSGLTAFHDFCNKSVSKSFLKCDSIERKKVLGDLSAIKDEKSLSASFFKTVKRYTIQAYASSEFFLTKVQVYKHIPGKFKGCVPA